MRLRNFSSFLWVKVLRPLGEGVERYGEVQRHADKHIEGKVATD